jgi:hypothetical protein
VTSQRQGERQGEQRDQGRGELEVDVRSRVAGSAAGRAPLDPVFLRLVDEELTLAELIRRTVEEQVRELVVRRQWEVADVRRTLDRQYLTGSEVEAQAREQGAVRFPSQGGADVRTIDPEKEAQRALNAFRRGVYHVFVDGRQVERLDSMVRFTPGARITFLRLTPLAGG